MEKSSDYMENIIALVSVDEKTLPLVSDCDILTATDSFYHMDRMADFNVMILYSFEQVNIFFRTIVVVLYGQPDFFMKITLTEFEFNE